MNKNLVISKNEIAQFCHKHHIRQLSVFGSALKDDFSNDRNVDILVEFQEDHVPGFAFFDMELELSQIIGRKVDLNTPNFLSRYFRDSIIKTAEVQYVQS
jgi:predicted nucleotidyltransferase